MFTLVPSAFFNPASKREALAEVATIKEDCEVRHIEIKDYNAVLIYTVDEDSVVSVPDIVGRLDKLQECPEYNKILCSIKEDRLYIAIAQGKTLLMANSFQVQDFTTAQYYIFLSIKAHQINPEMSTICWTSELGADEEMSLYRYFKSVVTI